MEAIAGGLGHVCPKASIVFSTQKEQEVDVNQVQRLGQGFAEEPHGDSGKSRYSVTGSWAASATDVRKSWWLRMAARGIDVGDVEAVFNYDVPQTTSTMYAGSAVPEGLVTKARPSPGCGQRKCINCATSSAMRNKIGFPRPSHPQTILGN